MGKYLPAEVRLIFCESQGIDLLRELLNMFLVLWLPGISTDGVERLGLPPFPVMCSGVMDTRERRFFVFCLVQILS